MFELFWGQVLKRNQSPLFALALAGVFVAPNSAFSDNVNIFKFHDPDLTFPLQDVLYLEDKNPLMSLECFRFYNPELSELDPSDDLPKETVFLISVQCDGPKPADYIENQIYSFTLQTGTDGGLTGERDLYSIRSLIDSDAENPLMDFEKFVELNLTANPWLKEATVDTLVAPDSVILIEMSPFD